MPAQRPLKSKKIPVRKGLEAVREILLGNENFKAVASEILIPTENSPPLAVFFQHWTRANHCFVIDPTRRRNIYPCLILRFAGTGWDIEPYLVSAPDIHGAFGVPLKEAWLRAQLSLVVAELERLLPDPALNFSHNLVGQPDGSVLADYPDINPAMRRVTEFIRGGPDSFFSAEDARLGWTMAREWSAWKKQGKQWGEVAMAVQADFGFPEISIRTLQRRASDLGLVKDW